MKTSTSCVPRDRRLPRPCVRRADLACGGAQPSRRRSAAGDPVAQINGAGATFPYPIYSKWFDEYHKMHPNVRDQLSVDRIGRRHPADQQRRRCSSAPPTAR